MALNARRWTTFRCFLVLTLAEERMFDVATGSGGSRRRLDDRLRGLNRSQKNGISSESSIERLLSGPNPAHRASGRTWAIPVMDILQRPATRHTQNLTSQHHETTKHKFDHIRGKRDFGQSLANPEPRRPSYRGYSGRHPLFRLPIIDT